MDETPEKPEGAGKRGRGRPRLEDPTSGMTIRLPESVKEELQKEADAEGIPLPTHVTKVLTRHVRFGVGTNAATSRFDRARLALMAYRLRTPKHQRKPADEARLQQEITAAAQGMRDLIEALSDVEDVDDAG